MCQMYQGSLEADESSVGKGRDTKTMAKSRDINLPNVEGKFFFSVIAQRLTNYLKRNDLIDNSVQKAGVPGILRLT